MSRRPKLRSIGIAAAVSAALVLGLSPASAVASPFGAIAGPRVARHAVAGESWQLFLATNASRVESNVAPLRLNRQMSTIARRHSVVMARKGELFHEDEPVILSTYLDGVSFRAWGQNVGFTSQDVASMEQAFMDSPDHRANILNSAFHRVAIGSVRVDGTLWVTVFFYG